MVAAARDARPHVLVCLAYPWGPFPPSDWAFHTRFGTDSFLVAGHPEVRIKVDRCLQQKPGPEDLWLPRFPAKALMTSATMFVFCGGNPLILIVTLSIRRVLTSLVPQGPSGKPKGEGRHGT